MVILESCTKRRANPNREREKEGERERESEGKSFQEDGENRA